MCSNYFSENGAVYKIMWKNTVGPDKPQMTIWRLRIAFRILKATDTYVILVLIHCNNGCRNLSQDNVIRALPVFFNLD